MKYYTIIIIRGKYVGGGNLGEVVGEIPELMGLYHKTKNKIEEKKILFKTC